MRLFGDDSSSRWRSYYQTSYLIIANNAGFSTGILKNVRLLDNDCVLLERSFFMSKQSPKNNEKTDVTVDDLEKEMQGRFNALNQSYQKVRLSRNRYIKLFLVRYHRWSVAVVMLLMKRSARHGIMHLRSFTVGRSPIQKLKNLN